MRLLGRTKSPSPDSKASANARASSSPERRTPPKLRPKEPGARHRGRKIQEYIFTEDDEEEFRMYCEQARNSREQRQRTATEGVFASATTSQSVQGGGDPASNIERSYSSPPVQRTLFLQRPLRRKGGPEISGMSLAADPRLAPCARIEDVGQDEDAQDGADSSDGENSFETAAEGDSPDAGPTIGGAGHRVDEQRRA